MKRLIVLVALVALVACDAPMEGAYYRIEPTADAEHVSCDVCTLLLSHAPPTLGLVPCVSADGLATTDGEWCFYGNCRAPCATTCLHQEPAECRY